MKTIFLIGYMGCGKSTLGRGLAERCDIEFIDLDDHIEALTGKRIRDIFATDGEKFFREIEQRTLVEISSKENVLIACGGGTPCCGDNMNLMNSQGTTVLLETSHNRLFERLKQGRSKRPLIAGLDDRQLESFISEQLSARMPYYRKATATFDSSLLENETQIEQTCETFINRFMLPRKNI